MKKQSIVILVCLIMVLGSCQKILLSFSGIKNPEVETAASVKEFLLKIGQDTTDVLCLDSSVYTNMKTQQFKPGRSSGFRPIQIRAYDRQGNAVMQWASCEGYLKQLGTFDSVPPKNQPGLDTSMTLQQDLDRYFYLDGKPSTAKASQEYDYTILVYFAKWFPKMSKESFRQVDKYIRNHPELKIRKYKIDADFMDFWHLEPQVIFDVKK